MSFGIDLGTVNSVIASVDKKGVATPLQNKIGELITPSVVSFDKENVYVGKEALNRKEIDPKNTITGIKRFIGYKFDASCIQEEIESVPYEVVSGTNGKAMARVNFKDKVADFTPEEISGYILASISNSVKKGSDSKEKPKVVITVPAYFSSTQRQATKDAGELAGLNVMSIISEPTAAAIAYGFGKPGKKEKTIFVFDFGGGTLDCTLMKAKDGNFDVIATSGDSHLGGEDVDNVICKELCKKIKSEFGVDLWRKDREKYIKKFAQLKKVSEHAKRELSLSEVCDIDIPCFIDEKGFSFRLTRNKFEEWCDVLFSRLEEPIESVLDAAEEKLGEDPKEIITDLIMVGGSSRIPYVADMLNDIFDLDPLFGVNPDTAVAEGAAIFAAGNDFYEENIARGGITKSFNGEIDIFDPSKIVDKYGFVDKDKNKIIDGAVVTKDNTKDVVPLPLGIELLDGSMSVLIKANTTVPYSNTREYSTSEDNQTASRITIFEGKCIEDVHKNRCLGSFNIYGLTPRPAYETKFNVTFEITRENLLHVTAEEIGGSAGFSHTIEVKNDVYLSEEEKKDIITRINGIVNSDKDDKDELIKDMESFYRTSKRKSRKSPEATEICKELHEKMYDIDDMTVEEIKKLKKDYVSKLSAYISI